MLENLVTNRTLRNGWTRRSDSKKLGWCFHVRLIEFFLRTPSVCSELAVCLNCRLIRWEQGSRAFLEEWKSAISNSLEYFYFLCIFITVSSLCQKKSCTKAVVSPNQFLVTLGLLSKHSKWSVCLFSKLTCCFLPLRSLLMCATCSWLSLVAPHVCPLCSCLH